MDKESDRLSLLFADVDLKATKACGGAAGVSSVPDDTARVESSFGRSKIHNPKEVVAWRRDNKASISQTAVKFQISVATVKRYCASI